MTTNWADIQRLAADLQRAQLAEGSKRLSENNCIEVMSKLISMGLVDIVISTDGKDYITRKHLVTEVKNECIANNNRISLTELASHLNVELNHIENAVTSVIRQSDAFYLCGGELIHRDFINDLCERLNKRLNEVGQISMLQLTKSWDLQTEILNNYILPEIGKKVHAVKYDDQLFTKFFLKTLKLKIRAILSAITTTISLSTICSYLNIKENLFLTLWNEIVDGGKLPGRIVGSKNSIKSLYVPKVQEELSKKFVKNSFDETTFIEVDILKKLGITNAKEFLKEIYSKEEFDSFMFFPNVIFNKTLWDEISNLTDEAMANDLFCEKDSLLHPGFCDLGYENSDYKNIVELLIKPHPNWRFTEENYVIYDVNILPKIIQAVEPYVLEQAQKDAPEIYKQLKSTKKTAPMKKTTNVDDEWGSSKGTSKKKSAKKSAPTKSKASSEEASDPTQIRLQWGDVLSELKRSPFPDELFDELSDEIEAGVNQIYRENVEKVLHLVEASGADEKRKLLEVKLVEIRALYLSICVFEDGANSFESSLSEDLKQFLLKNLGIEFCNLVLSIFVSSPDFSSLSSKARAELIATIDEVNARDAVKDLFESLQTMEKFHEGVFGLKKASVFLKQPDKQARQEYFDKYSSELSAQLANNQTNAPVFLLVAVLILILNFHKIAIHASGKFVAPLISFLNSKNQENPDSEDNIPLEIIESISETQKLVVLSLKKKTSSPPSDESLQENIQKIYTYLSK